MLLTSAMNVLKEFRENGVESPRMPWSVAGFAEWETLQQWRSSWPGIAGWRNSAQSKQREWVWEQWRGHVTCRPSPMRSTGDELGQATYPPSSHNLGESWPHLTSLEHQWLKQSTCILRTKVGFFVLGNLTQLELTMSICLNGMFPPTYIY